MSGMKAWTDAPIEQLGDPPNKLAPIRPVVVVSYDGNKYCRIIVGGLLHDVQVKAAYIYQRKGRYGEVPKLSRRQLRVLENSGKA